MTFGGKLDEGVWNGVTYVLLAGHLTAGPKTNAAGTTRVRVRVFTSKGYLSVTAVCIGQAVAEIAEAMKGDFCSLLGRIDKANGLKMKMTATRALTTRSFRVEDLGDAA
jgi:hypothetical protein